MKIFLAAIVLVLVSGCSHNPSKTETPTQLEVGVDPSYTKDQVRRACWKGIKQACGVKGSCYEKAGNYCETDKMYQDILGMPKK